jgi:hypothetical protein
MKYTIYEDPITRQCAHLPLPHRFLEGDPLPAVATDRWFENHEAATAALAELLDRDEGAPAASADLPAPVQADGAPPLIDASPRPVTWPRH